MPISPASNNTYLWPGFSSHWPSAGPGFEEKFTPMGAWGLPAVNTILLLSSGVTVTLAHWNLIANQRGKLLLWLGATILLGVAFLACQAIEYAHAYSELNLKLTTGAYGTTFFMLTGFHGFHVTCGAIMLTVIWFRCLSGHFRPEHHFAFEGVAWYWHFVDVVWLGLFILFTGYKRSGNLRRISRHQNTNSATDNPRGSQVLSPALGTAAVAHHEKIAEARLARSSAVPRSPR